MLTVVLGNRIEALAEQLMERLDSTVANPLEPRRVVVGHVEMGQWLARLKASRDGICANLQFELPGAAIWRLMRDMLPDIPADNRFTPEALTLRILAQQGDVHPELDRMLADRDTRGRLRFARRQARLYDQYLVFRPDWIIQWEAGQESHWQAELWRALVQPEDWHWARCWDRLGEQESSVPVTNAQPIGQLSVIGVAELSPSYLDCLRRAGQSMDITLYQWRPSRQYWGDVPSPRARNRPPHEPSCPLLSSWGLVIRDVIHWMLELDLADQELYTEPEATSLIQHIRKDLLLDQPGGGSSDTTQTGLSVQVCASRRREIEVCRDHLLSRLAADPTLFPSDVLVLCRDLDSYLPHVHGVFPEEQPGAIRWRAVGAQRAAQGGALEALVALLEELSRPRLDRGVLDLLALPSLRRSFDIKAADLPDVQRWIREGGVYHDDGDKFGFDRGMSRLTTAMLAGEDAAGWPSEESVHPAELEKLGRLYQFLDRLTDFRRSGARDRPLTQWLDWLGGVVESCIRPGPNDEADMALIGDAALGVRRDLPQIDPVLDFAAFRDLMLSRLSTERGSTGTPGGVTFASFGAGRLTPARLIYVLGLNDGQFPAPLERSDLDLMSRHPRRGDRSRQREDRMLMLEWLGSAEDELVLSCVGTDVRDGTDLALSAVVEELLQYAERQHRVCRPRLLTRFPIQGFSSRYGDALTSYAHQFNVSATVDDRPFQLRPLEAPDLPLHVDLEQLVAFAKAPTPWYLRHRLGVWLDIPEDLLDSQPPLQLDSLSRYLAVAYGLRQSGRDGLDQRLQQLVSLPEGQLGVADASRVAADVAGLVQRRTELLGDGEARLLDLNLPIKPMALTGRLDACFGDRRVVLHAGKANAKRIIELWIRHLAFCQVRGGDCTSVLIARDSQLTLAGVQDAASHLAFWLNLFAEGQRRPLPVFPETSRRYARATDHRDWDWGDWRSGLAQADQTYTGQGRQAMADANDPYLQLVFPDGSWQQAEFARLAREIWLPIEEHLSSETV